MNTKAKENVLKNLARMDTDAAKKTIEQHAEKVYDVLLTSDSYDDLIANLELLDVFVYRVWEKSIEVLKTFLDRMTSIDLKYSNDYHVSYAKDLTCKAMDVLYVLRFIDPASVYPIIFSYLDDENQTVLEHSTKLSQQISEYDLRAINKIGYYAQEKILEILQSWDDETLAKRREIVSTMCRELLDATSEANTSDYQTITINFATLVINDTLKKIRNDTIELLISMHKAQGDVVERIKIMQTLREATRLPTQTQYNDDWVELVKSDFGKVSDFYLSIFEQSSFLEYQEMEHQLYWFGKRGLGFDLHAESAATLRKLIKDHEEYQIFKVILGGDLSYSEHWEEDDWDYKKVREHRHERIDVFLKDIPNDFKKWHKRLHLYATDYKAGNGTSFEFMSDLLNKLGKEYPDLALRLLEDAKSFEFYIPPLIIGIAASDLKDKIIELCEAWLEKGLFIEAMLRSSNKLFFENKEEFLERLLDKSIELKNASMISEALSIFSRNYEENPAFYGRVFVKSASSIRALGHDWSNIFLFKPFRIISDLPDEEQELLIEMLVDKDRLDYHEEDMLAPIAKERPELIVSLFEKRIEKQISKRNDDERGRYDALPYEFYRLSEPLAQNGNKILPMIFDWYKQDDWLYRWDGARFIGNVFVHVEDVLRTFLIDKIQNGTKDDAIHAVHILREFDGNDRILPVCIEAIKKYIEDDEMKSEIYCSLDSTGVVCGEYGMRDAYKEKMLFADEMLKIEDDAVKEFANEYKQQLNRMIEAEHNRATKDLEVRKKVWGVNEDKDNEE
tara:strand:+ start:1170 stop:3533 length:2364 start_codon:yes stop_codon:yes gene_type:complete